MRAQFDTTLVGGFAGAGHLLERSLLGAIRKGSLGFDDLKRAGLSALEDWLRVLSEALAPRFSNLDENEWETIRRAADIVGAHRRGPSEVVPNSHNLQAS